MESYPKQGLSDCHACWTLLDPPSMATTLPPPPPPNTPAHLPPAAPHRVTEELVQTAHSDKINSLAFPAGFSELFATCANGGVRVWHLHGCRELLRIALPNLECRCVAFSPVRGCGMGRGGGEAGDAGDSSQVWL